MEKGNIFSNIPETFPDELFENLLKTDQLRLERILSAGQATPPGEWYEQERDEWVILLQGSALLQFADPEASLELGPGDYVHIPARRKHRVEWTDKRQKTIWLALHYRQLPASDLPVGAGSQPPAMESQEETGCRSK